MSESKFAQFENLNIDSSIKSALAKMNFVVPTPIQKLVIPPALERKDILGQAQTGTGKTTSFGIPVVQNVNASNKYVQAMVLTPTRELAKQVSDEIQQIADGSLDILPVYGGVNINAQIKRLDAGATVVVGTPGRITDLMRRGKLKVDRISMLVLDEVDEMLDMGFYQDVEDIFVRLPEKKQTMLFSATLPEKIQRLGRRFLKKPVILSTSDDNVMSTTTEHYFYEVFDRERAERLADVIDYEDIERGVIFCKTKSEVDRVDRVLKGKGFNIDKLHGDIAQNVRDAVMKKYKSGILRLLVATNVAARGIDVHGVTHVINYHMPQDPEKYVHRTGRTGRAGKAGVSITFVTPSEYWDLMKIQEKNDLPIIKKALPNKNELFQKRVQIMIDKIKEEMTKSDYKDIYKIVKKRIPFLWRGKALALLIKKGIERGDDLLNLNGVKKSRSSAKTFDSAKRPVSTRNSSTTKSRNITDSFVKLFINIGKNHKVGVQSLKDLCLNKAKVKESEMGRIFIKDKYSFINVKKGSEKKIIKKLSGIEINNFKVNVEVSHNSRGNDNKNKRVNKSNANRSSISKAPEKKKSSNARSYSTKSK